MAASPGPGIVPPVGSPALSARPRPVGLPSVIDDREPSTETPALHRHVPPSLWLLHNSAARAVGGLDPSAYLANGLEFCSPLCRHGSQGDFVPGVGAPKQRRDEGQMVDSIPTNPARPATRIRQHLAMFAEELGAVWVPLAEIERAGNRPAALRAIAFRLGPRAVVRKCWPLVLKPVRRAWTTASTTGIG